MKAYTYLEKGHFALTDKPKPTIQEPTDAIVRVTLGSGGFTAVVDHIEEEQHGG